MKPAHNTIALLVLLAAMAMPASAPAVPREFFGIVPQTILGEADAERMRVGRIGSVRVPLGWNGVQPGFNGGYDWGGFDDLVAVAARQHLRVLPFVYSSPEWVARRYTTLPVYSARQRRAWADFLRAAVERYGPTGEFWREHRLGSGDYVPKVPLMFWQIWNEANFFYFAWPASPRFYARLLKHSGRVIKRVDPRVKVIASGLFAEPNAKRPNAMDATDFLDEMYRRSPGIKHFFDGVALHPYAYDVRELRRLVEEVRRVTHRNGDPRARLFLTELAWGSDYNPEQVSFERGTRIQIREMRRAYRYLIGNRGRLNLQGVYWFTWQDIDGSCTFCDSTGLFHRGNRLRPKRAWHAFVSITGGRPRP